MRVVAVATKDNYRDTVFFSSVLSPKTQTTRLPYPVFSQVKSRQGKASLVSHRSEDCHSPPPPRSRGKRKSPDFLFDSDLIDSIRLQLLIMILVREGACRGWEGGQGRRRLDMLQGPGRYCTVRWDPSVPPHVTPIDVSDVGPDER